MLELLRLPWYIRIPIALSLIGIGVLVFLYGENVNTFSVRRFAPGAILVVGGAVLLLMGPSKAQKRGYHF